MIQVVHISHWITNLYQEGQEKFKNWLKFCTVLLLGVDLSSTENHGTDLGNSGSQRPGPSAEKSV